MKAMTSCLAAIAVILLTFDLSCVAGQFSFSLPGKWGKGKRSPFKFSLPGDWGNRSGRKVEASAMTEECPGGMDIERMFDILNRLQVSRPTLNIPRLHAPPSVNIYHCCPPYWLSPEVCSHILEPLFW